MTHIPSLSTITSSELSAFVQREIEPDAAYIKSVNTVVNQLCQFMQNSFPKNLRPSEVRKCGSLGKGTAVKGKSDADLVVFLAEFHSVSDLRREIERILHEMQEYLVKHVSALPHGCKLERTTSHAVKVLITCHGQTHSVDILPSVAILKRDKKCNKEMEPLTHGEKEYYSAALAPLQIEFVARVPTKVKTLIRLIKYWRKTEFKEITVHLRLPSPYALELIVIAVWEATGKPENFDLCKGFYHVLRAIADYRGLKHVWTVNYGSHYVQRDPFYVVDPANPFNNVLTACNCWETVAAKAKSLMQAPLFKGCTDGSSGWQ